ncbi:hypothetical protein V2J09_001336, partial [Rumex salicifolius]
KNAIGFKKNKNQRNWRGPILFFEEREILYFIRKRLKQRSVPTWTNSIPWKKRKKGNENLLNLNLTIPQNKISIFHLRLSLLRRLKIVGLHSREYEKKAVFCTHSLIEVSVAIEGMFYKENISNIDLSEQQIIDGCHGIDDKGIEVDKFIKKFRKNPSVATIENYPANIVDGNYVKQQLQRNKVIYHLISW